MSPTPRKPPAHRRARRSGRLIAVIIAAAVVIAGGTAVVIAVSVNNGKSGTQTAVTPAAGGNATSPAPTTVPTPASPSPSPTPSPPGNSAAAAAVQKCRATIAAADATVAAARAGAAHWAVHTQARTDFLAHKITLVQTNAEFKRTRLAGPSDQKTFADALAAYQKVADGCNGLPNSATATTCSSKANALHTTVAAGQAVMKDWASHLNNMALHADHEMSATQARNEWIAAWKDAPPHLNAFSAADTASKRSTSCPAA